MTNIEKKALALLNEVWADRGRNVTLDRFSRDSFAISEALCRAIERHEAFRQEVSDALLWHCKYTDGVLEGLQHLIIAKPDPLVEIVDEVARDLHITGASTLHTFRSDDFRNALREALAKRGGKIVWENSDA